MSRLATHTSRGFTLIEMIIAMVVLAAAAGILFSFSATTARSADPMIQQQAIAIAQGYREEAMLKPYSDPDGGETDSCEVGEARNTYDDVADYDCINDSGGALDQFGGSLAGLGNYNIAISVSTTSIGAPAVTARRIDVTVSHDTFADINLVLTAYRTSYY